MSQMILVSLVGCDFFVGNKAIKLNIIRKRNKIRAHYRAVHIEEILNKCKLQKHENIINIIHDYYHY